RPLIVPGTEQLQATSEALVGARRPVIIAGNGARGPETEKALLALAEALQAQVTTTAGGKGVFPETHPLALGAMGNHGNPAANTAVSQADVVLAVATKLGPIDTCFGNPEVLGHQNIIQIDVEPKNTAWTVPVA